MDEPDWLQETRALGVPLAELASSQCRERRKVKEEGCGADEVALRREFLSLPLGPQPAYGRKEKGRLSNVARVELIDLPNFSWNRASLGVRMWSQFATTKDGQDYRSFKVAFATLKTRRTSLIFEARLACWTKNGDNQ